MNVAVPHDKLHPDTLLALIEEFVTRNGAVHGHADTPLKEQIASVRAQLVAGTVVIVFDDESESCTLCAAKDWRQSQNGA